MDGRDKPGHDDTYCASARACRRAVDRSGGLAEQNGALFRGANAAQIRIYLLRLGVGAFDRRAGTDRFEPALELREIFRPWRS